MKWKIAGINFDHFHMGDLLRYAVGQPNAELVGICDEHPERMAEAQRNFSIPSERIFKHHATCLERTRPDVVILCPAAARHGEWTAKIAPFGVHILMEKPFAGSLAEADAMIHAQRQTGRELFINWPLTWMRSMQTAKRLVDQGRIGEVLEFHHYGGNRGPLWHGADKIEKTAEQVAAEKPGSWFYQRRHGGGSLLDYAGYGTTLGTWFQGGRAPIEVTAVTDEPEGIEVDEHSILILRYAHGLSKVETRWGTFTDPWHHQPQPRCGFVIVGSEGTINAGDYDESIWVQTRDCPQGMALATEPPAPPFQNPIQYFLHCLSSGQPVSGPCSIAISRIGQQIVDAAATSAREKRTIRL
jgi:glucose-fructose oxidoreductase